MHRPIVASTTDFGLGSPYVAATKGVILSICPDVSLVDRTHAAPQRDVRQAALVLAETTPWFPPRSIHVAVVDPGVGTDRELLWAEIDEFFRTYADQPATTFVALVGSSDRLELAIVGDSAAAMRGVAVGTPVTVRW